MDKLKCVYCGKAIKDGEQGYGVYLGDLDGPMHSECYEKLIKEKEHE